MLNSSDFHSSSGMPSLHSHTFRPGGRPVRPHFNLVATNQLSWIPYHIIWQWIPHRGRVYLHLSRASVVKQSHSFHLIVWVVRCSSHSSPPSLQGAWHHSILLLMWDKDPASSEPKTSMKPILSRCPVITGCLPPHWDNVLWFPTLLFSSWNRWWNWPSFCCKGFKMYPLLLYRTTVKEAWSRILSSFLSPLVTSFGQ